MHLVKLARSIGFGLLAVGLIYIFFADGTKYTYIFGFVTGTVFLLDGVIALGEGKKKIFVWMYVLLAAFLYALSLSLFLHG